MNRSLILCAMAIVGVVLAGAIALAAQDQAQEVDVLLDRGAPDTNL